MLTSCASGRVPGESIVTFGRFYASFDETIGLEAQGASEARVFLFGGQEVPNIRGWMGTTLTLLPLSASGRERETEILEGRRYWRLVLHAGARCSERLRARLLGGHDKLIAEVTEGLRLIPSFSIVSVDESQVRCYVVSPEEMQRMPPEFVPPDK